MHHLSSWIQSLYGKFQIDTGDYEELFELMSHDKKNQGTNINFTLITSVGEVEINRNCSKEEIFEALDYFREINKA
jgi:3-dehydroquinate synthase